MSSPVNKIDAEKKTVKIMTEIYCHKKHSTKNGLCRDCSSLLEYAHSRLDKCKFGNKKGTCGKCSIQCYKPEMREKIREVMKFSGPRMIYKHPLLALKHLLDR